jgi:hypothetical protein
MLKTIQLTQKNLNYKMIYVCFKHLVTKITSLATVKNYSSNEYRLPQWEATLKHLKYIDAIKKIEKLQLEVHVNYNSFR